MPKFDEDLLSKARITRAVVTGENQVTLYAGTQQFTVTAVTDEQGVAVIEVRNVDPQGLRVVIDNGRTKPRAKAHVINLADFRDKK